MENEEINYKTLRKIQQIEKNSPSLTELYPGFYNSLSEYIEKLENRLIEESSNQKKVILEDEIQNIKKIAISIYEQREKKILLAAVSKARGGNPNLKNVEEVENNLYENILGLMLQSRKKILEEKSIKKKENKKDKTTDLALTNNDEEIQKNINPVISIKKDIPEFVGTDEKKYILRKNDIVSLPENMSKLLIKRGVVKEIEE